MNMPNDTWTVRCTSCLGVTTFPAHGPLPDKFWTLRRSDGEKSIVVANYCSIDCMTSQIAALLKLDLDPQWMLRVENYKTAIRQRAAEKAEKRAAKERKKKLTVIRDEETA